MAMKTEEEDKNENERATAKDGPVNPLTAMTNKSASEKYMQDDEAKIPLTPYQSVDAHGNIYPEGGLQAWLVVFGSFAGMTACFGFMNSLGIYQAYLSTHQLADRSPSTVGWIFSIYVFLSFLCGLQWGPIFDMKGPRMLLIAGTVMLVGGVFAVAESTQLWHFFLSFSVTAGIGTSLIFTPAVSAISHFFLLKRGAAVGLATTGGSVGGIVFPLALQQLFPKVGFQWATRILGFMLLFLLLIANLLIRTRLPRPNKTSVNSSIWPDWRIFKNLTFVLTTAGVFFIEWALFVPVGYITLYALSHQVSYALSYQMLALLNAGSFFGRWLPGMIADRLGRFNIMIITVGLCTVSVLCLWLTAGSNTAQLIAFVVIFGFCSGSNISLVPVCVGQLCKTEEFGRWFASLYTIVSFGCLTGIPVAGSILSRSGSDHYSGLIGFVGACYAVGLASFTAARVRQVGWKVTAVF